MSLEISVIFVLISVVKGPSLKVTNLLAKSRTGSLVILDGRAPAFHKPVIHSRVLACEIAVVTKWLSTV